MTTFAHPAALALCLVPPVAAIARAVRARRRAALVALPLDVWNGTPSEDAPAVWRALRAASSLCFGLAWIALALAAAGPSSEDLAASESRRGLDIVFAVDASPSMAAQDLEPTRLDAAKAFVRAYVESPEGAAGASVGIVAFGAEAALACPPTSDYAVVLERLGTIGPGILGDGTALGLGLSSSLRQVSASGAPGSMVVLLSDGEDNVGLVHPSDAARSLRLYGASLFVIGLGSRGDVPIDYVNPETGQRMSGSYRSGFDEGAMASIAEAAGGEYLFVPDARSLASLVPELGAAAAAVAKARSADGAASAYGAYPGGSAPRRPASKSLFLAAMALAAAGWAVRRLAFGGLA